MFTVKLETQDGQFLPMGTWHLLKTVTTIVRALDREWESGKDSIWDQEPCSSVWLLLQNWEGSDVVATDEHGVRWMMVGDGPDDEVWESF